MAIGPELQACREHARQAEDVPTFPWSTVMLARLLTVRSEWNQARRLLEEIPEQARDASAWHQLATIDLNQGDYAAAREKFTTAMEIWKAIGDRTGEAATWNQLATIDFNQGDHAAAREKFATSLQIKPAIGNRTFEAATWHNLATIDLHQGEYAAAREKFDSSLQIEQAIGNRAGEANTWNQLGHVAYASGRGKDAVRLMAVAFLISHTIGHNYVKTIAQNFATLCGMLGIDQAQRDAILREAALDYQKDRGQGLVERAFGGDDPGKST
ncbi:MAG: tetratricopeptide repeat protein [Planctomycetaceae bacterium]|nr:tetratricopeptide repeat protein [Planctomycetaceae bacterium]